MGPGERDFTKVSGMRNKTRGLTIFDRKRDGIGEDRRTWALMLALQRSPVLRAQFVEEVLQERGAGESIVVRAWPSGYGAKHPDAEIFAPGRFLAIFEAKVQGNRLSARQTRRYLKWAKARMAAEGTTKAYFISFLYEELPARDVRRACEDFGIPLCHVSHARLVNLLTKWRDETEDGIASFLAGDLAAFFKREMGIAVMKPLVPEELRSYAEYHRAVEHVTKQVEARFVYMVEILGEADATARWYWEDGYHFYIEVPGAPCWSGVTVELAPDARVSTWLEFPTGKLAGSPTILEELAGEETLVAKSGAVLRKTEDGHALVWIEDSGQFFGTDAFQAPKHEYVRRCVSDTMVAAKIWPALLERTFKLNLRKDFPTAMERIATRWLRAEAQAASAIEITPDFLKIDNRGEIASWAKLQWRGDGLLGRKATLWAEDARPVKQPGWSGPDWANGRFVDLKGADHFREALASVGAEF